MYTGAGACTPASYSSTRPPARLPSPRGDRRTELYYKHLQGHILTGESRLGSELFETRKAVFPNDEYGHLPVGHTACTVQVLKTVPVRFN